jgi:peroxiredoxin
MLLVYRGMQCPVCRKYVPELNRLVGEFESKGVVVLAPTMDPPERAEEMAATWGLDTMPVG